MFVDLSDDATRGENINLKGFRVRQWLIINSYHRSYLHDTHFGSIGPRVRSWFDQTNRHSFAFPFFFLFFFIFEAQTRNLAVLSERDSRKIARFLSIVICKRILCPFFHCRDIRQRNFALLLRDNVWYIHDTVLQLSIYNDRRNVKNCSSMRSKIENFSKKFYSFHECENILFFSAKSKVFVKNAKRIFYSNIQCPFSLFDFCLSVYLMFKRTMPN